MIAMRQQFFVIFCLCLLYTFVEGQCCAGGCPSGQYCICNSTNSIDACALQLTEQNSTFNVTQTTGYYYFQPNSEEYDLIQLVFCGSAVSGASNLLMVMVEQQPGSYPNPTDSQNVTFNATSQCLAFYVTGAKFEKMSNGQRQNLLMSLALNISGTESMTSYIVGQEATGLLFVILFSSIGVVVLVLVIAGGLLIWRRCKAKKAMSLVNDLAHLDQHMPVQRLEQVHPTEINCSVCLVDIGLGDNIRKTPCEHYFH